MATYILNRHNARPTYPLVLIATMKKTSKVHQSNPIARTNKMHLEQASTIDDWQAASRLLLDVMYDLDHKGHTLWMEKQLTLNELQQQYQEGELYLAKSKGLLVGVVFLHEQDPYFWPEITACNSLFLHKLAIHPQYRGFNKGKQLIQLAEQEAIQRGLIWLRLDCDDREPLHRFYLTNNFSLLDIQSKDGFTFARYQRAIKNAAN